MKEVELLKHQVDFISDCKTPYLGLVGGFRAGKTYALIYKALMLSSLNHLDGALLEPTHTMINKVLIPTIELIFPELDIPYEYNKTEGKLDFELNKRKKRIWLMSALNYRRAAGMSLSWFGIDEMDTMDNDTANAAWNMMVSRLTSGNNIQGFNTSTPEGYNFLYDFFIQNASHDRKLIRARTKDNPFITDSYIEMLEANYDKKQLDAYLNGEFVNLTSGNVYYNFNRYKNVTTKTLNDFPNHIIHIGQDFNVGNCTSTISVIHRNNIYVLDELTGISNTEEVIKTIFDKYGRYSEFCVYPDASGSDAFKTADSDIAMFARAGMEVRTKGSNPKIKDRVSSVNAKMNTASDGPEIFINIRNCPELVRTLEQQGYDEKGRPDKSSGLDHMADAFGYFVHYNYPCLHSNELFLEN